MEYYGHIDSSTPSLTISLLPGYRGLGIGTQLLDSLLFLLRENGYLRASLSVQRKNPALRLYERAEFQILEEKDTEYLMLRDITQAVQQGSVDMETTMEMTDGLIQSFDGLSLIRWNGAGQIRFLQEFGCNENRYDPYAQGKTPVFREEQALWF